MSSLRGSSALLGHVTPGLGSCDMQGVVTSPINVYSLSKCTVEVGDRGKKRKELRMKVVIMFRYISCSCFVNIGYKVEILIKLLQIMQILYS